MLYSPYQGIDTEKETVLKEEDYRLLRTTTNKCGKFHDRLRGGKSPQNDHISPLFPEIPFINTSKKYVKGK
ncbi:MAG: hypothetical protein ACFFE8_11600 [Candidatus Heimdallarchaeota archaeon]